MIDKTPVKDTAIAAALGVNGIVVCNCGHTGFKVGIAYNLDTGNNFIRILECGECGNQMPATHRSDDHLAPTVGLSS